MTGMSSMSPFTGSGFRATKPRPKERRCWDCRKPMDTTTRLVRCGHCHDQRMRAIRDARDERASLSSPGRTMSLPEQDPTDEEPAR